jgi:FixJ family two-component response regulator
MTESPTVFIVEDDPGMRESLVALVSSVRLRARAYETAQQFLDDFEPDRPGCLVLDLRLPGMSGRQLQEALARRGNPLPIIFLSGHGDMSTAVAAMRDGAVDFLEKPHSGQRLLDVIQVSLERDARRRREQSRRETARSYLEQLTSREREILDLMVEGLANKVIARRLQVSEKNIEYHRAKIYEKTQASSYAELIRLVLTSGDLETESAI